MISLNALRELLRLEHDQCLLRDMDFFFVYDLNTSKNLMYAYWDYEEFSLPDKEKNECKSA